MEKIDKILLNSKEVGQILSIPLRTLQKLSQEGRVRAVKVGKQWRYHKSDIEKYFNSGTDFANEPKRKAGNFTVFRKECNEHIERRSYSRINSSFICRYSINLLPFKNINNEGIIKNISASGILLVNKSNGTNEIEIDDPISIKFFLAPDNGQRMEVSAKGRVVRKIQDAIGIKFKNINKEMQNRIIEYVG